MLRTDPAYAGKAAKVASLALDVSEYLAKLPLDAPAAPSQLAVAYHSACSLQHGQRVHREPKELLSRLGFVVKEVRKAICAAARPAPTTFCSPTSRIGCAHAR